MSGFCRWYGKDMEDVTEHEQEQCEENGQDCRECPDLVIKEQESNGHQRLCIYNHNKARPDTCTGHRPRRWTVSVFDRA